MKKSWIERTALAATAALIMGTAGCASSQSGEQRSVRSEAFAALVACDYDRAETLFAAAIAEDPGNAYDHLNLGVAQQYNGRLGAARASYQTAKDLGPDLPIVVKTTDKSTCALDFPDASGADAATVGDLASLNLDLLD
ncbi:MAG: hypothetical protein K9L70_15405 [Thiohalocapsa sp.]|nr:hypothetical protein [Thiohalocapsa sp.]MCF7991106.1 hypothetical protein [Thiohalocapsa sp.]